MITTIHINQEGPELEIIRQLFRDYEKELDADICFQSFEDELKDPLLKYGHPDGDLILAKWNEEFAGCIALKKLEDDGACEMKRLYVKPEFRKNKIAKKLVDSLMDSAVEKGYSVIKLDTLNKLQPAIKLYQQFGFYEISPYYPNPLEGVVYMEKKLTDAG